MYFPSCLLVTTSLGRYELQFRSVRGSKCRAMVGSISRATVGSSSRSRVSCLVLRCSSVVPPLYIEDYPVHTSSAGSKYINRETCLLSSFDMHWAFNLGPPPNATHCLSADMTTVNALLAMMISYQHPVKCASLCKPSGIPGGE